MKHEICTEETQQTHGNRKIGQSDMIQTEFPPIYVTQHNTTQHNKTRYVYYVRDQKLNLITKIASSKSALA